MKNKVFIVIDLSRIVEIEYEWIKAIRKKWLRYIINNITIIKKIKCSNANLVDTFYFFYIAIYFRVPTRKEYI